MVSQLLCACRLLQHAQQLTTMLAQQQESLVDDSSTQFGSVAAIQDMLPALDPSGKGMRHRKACMRDGLLCLNYCSVLMHLHLEEGIALLSDMHACCRPRERPQEMQCLKCLMLQTPAICPKRIAHSLNI